MLASRGGPSNDDLEYMKNTHGHDCFATLNARLCNPKARLRAVLYHSTEGAACYRKAHKQAVPHELLHTLHMLRDRALYALAYSALAPAGLELTTNLARRPSLEGDHVVAILLRARADPTDP